MLFRSPFVALTATGWLYALPEVGREVPPTLWLEVLQSTLTQVDRAWAQGPSEGLFPWVIWACEVPLALAKQMSHLGGKDRIVSETLNRLALLIEQTAEDPETLLTFGAQDLRAFVASLVRSRWAADSVGARKWYPPQRRALAKLQSIMLYLTDANGHAMLDQADSSRHSPDFWGAMMEMCSSHKKVQLATAIALPDDVGREQGYRPSKLRKSKSNDARLPKPSHYWEKNRIVSMRRNWRRKDCQVALDFSRDSLWLDISDASGRRIFSGDWGIELAHRGKPIDIDVAWNEVCWFSDDDVDCLELECDLDGKCTLYRQLMLMRDEGMIYMADSYLSAPGVPQGEWKLTSKWTLAPETEFCPETKTTEGRIVRNVIEEDGSQTTEPVALLLPLGLPEWRRGCSAGSLKQEAAKKEAGSQTSKSVVLESVSSHARQVSPLLVAIAPIANAKGPATAGPTGTPKYTWRQLTVAQNLNKVTSEDAQACRVQIGNEQWV